MSFNQMKRQEAQSRMANLRKARRSPQAAAALQRRVSLVGEGAKWRITNLNQVARAIAKWA
jgi:lipase chaperone LimK